MPGNSHAKIGLKQVARATVTTVIDNYVDILLPSTERVERPPRMKGNVRMPPLLAEHGLSIFLEVFEASTSHAILMDFGISKMGVPHNLGVLDILVDQVETFVISHGHHDHIGAIEEVFNQLSQKPRPVVVHPDAFLQTRFVKLPDGREILVPGLEEGLIEKTGNTVIDGKGPVLAASEHVLILGEIPRINDFETGLPSAYYRREGEVFKDHIMDDKAMVLHVRDKGLVVITGCGHAGIINTIKHAQQSTGVEKVFCVMGGFHLGGLDEEVLRRTLDEMKRIDPEMIVPCHCTGLRALHEFETMFPKGTVINASGTKIHL